MIALKEEPRAAAELAEGRVEGRFRGAAASALADFFVRPLHLSATGARAAIGYRFMTLRRTIIWSLVDETTDLRQIQKLIPHVAARRPAAATHLSPAARMRPAPLT
ncbi:uncharacterized protein VTP21DRAFT_456 [Calcarisporiella thermophila]|uniref:uncharacterized protein n=1 Tax=Calcarisporiella thermophila TaxID=911321 RepID=UPI0037433CFA